MKLLLSVLCLVTLAAFASSYSASWGRRNAVDYLLSREKVFLVPKKNDYWNVNVDYPRSGQGNSRNITYISCIDNFRNSSGPTPTLWSGGPGWRYATINLKSQFGRGMDVTVEIYGK